ncbi:MAG: glycosyltransferase [Cyclobacteriaceae bacterium]|nr:glycosyltransferase [Cyclobacteriaceae bacterium]
MKKRRIVLASILKPVNDTRMTEKLGASLAKVEGNEVYVIGYPIQTNSSLGSIISLPLKPFTRISLGRLLAPLSVLKKCIQVKPELLIVNTHELLIVSIVNRILFGTKIVYDIQENYPRNILYTPAFPLLLRPVLAAWVRLKETLLTPLFNSIILAEKCYKQELPFVRKNYVVMENKAILPDHFERQPPTNKIRLIFSGTLAESTGVFQAINLAQKLHQLNPKVELEIIGYCARTTTLTNIRSAISGSSFIKLTGGNYLVPHTEILEAIRTASFGIICYPPAPQVQNKVPTKLYEYLACQLPILLRNEPTWSALCELYSAAVIVDFNKPDPTAILAQMDKSFYTSKPINVTWQTEEARFINWLTF